MVRCWCWNNLYLSYLDHNSQINLNIYVNLLSPNLKFQNLYFLQISAKKVKENIINWVFRIFANTAQIKLASRLGYVPLTLCALIK